MRYVTFLILFAITLGMLGASVTGQGGGMAKGDDKKGGLLLEADSVYAVKDGFEVDRYYWRKDKTALWEEWTKPKAAFPSGTRFRIVRSDANYAYIEFPNSPEAGLYAVDLGKINDLYRSEKFARIILFKVDFETKAHPGLFQSSQREVSALASTPLMSSEVLKMFGWIDAQEKKEPSCRLYAERYRAALKRLRDPAAMTKEDLEKLDKLSEIRLTKTPDEFTISHAPSEAYFLTRIPSLRYRQAKSSIDDEARKKLAIDMKAAIDGWKDRSTFAPDPILGGEGLVALKLLPQDTFDEAVRDGTSRTAKAKGWPSEKLFYRLSALMALRSKFEDHVLSGREFRIEALPEELGEIYDLYARNGLQSNLLVRALFIEIDVLLSELVKEPFDVKIAISPVSPKGLAVGDAVIRKVSWPDLIDATGLATVIYEKEKTALSIQKK